MYHSFFIHLSVDGFLACFHVLAVINRVAMNICILFNFCFLRVYICSVVGLLGLMVVLFLVFKGIFILFSIVAVSSYIPTTGQEGSLFSTPSPVFIICRFFGDGHSDQCKVIFHCSFDLQLSNNEQS